MKRINFIIYIFIMVILSILLFFIQRCKCFIVESGSMKPTLEICEMIVVKDQNKYEKEDIITYYDEEFKGYITHRIVEITEDGKFITKGDFNNINDKNIVDLNQIVGKVIFKSKILGLLFYKYKVTTIIVILVSLMFWNLYSIIFKKG